MRFKLHRIRESVKFQNLWPEGRGKCGSRQVGGGVYATTHTIACLPLAFRLRWPLSRISWLRFSSLVRGCTV
jgi:hypothetical protein